MADGGAKLKFLGRNLDPNSPDRPRDQNSPEDQYVLLKNLGWASLQLKDYGDAEERLNAASKLQKTAHLTEFNNFFPNPSFQTFYPSTE